MQLFMLLRGYLQTHQQAVSQGYLNELKTQLIFETFKLQKEICQMKTEEKFKISKNILILKQHHIFQNNS